MPGKQGRKTVRKVPAAAATAQGPPHDQDLAAAEAVFWSVLDAPPPRARDFDERGRPLELTPAQQRVRAADIVAAIDSLASITDGSDADDGLWREMMRDFDAQRPHRPLFEGMY